MNERLRLLQVANSCPGLRVAGPVLAGATLLLATSCGTLSSRDVADPGPAIARLRQGGGLAEEVTRVAQPLVESGEVYGMAIGVVTPDGNTAVFGYGETDNPEGRPVPDGQTLFQLGSVSKLFVMTLLGQMVANGELEWDDTVREIVPPEVRLHPAVGAVTVHELATHTSGLPREPFTPAMLGSFLSYMFTANNVYQCIDKEYLIRHLRRHGPKAKLKGTYRYSNLGLGLLSYLIEMKTGADFTELLEERITGPLGMTNTVGWPADRPRTQRAIGHAGKQLCFRAHRRRMPEWDMGDLMRPSSGLYSTVDDLLIFAKSNLGMLGHPLDPVMASTHAVQLSTPLEDVALGWLLDDVDLGAQTLVYKHGMVAGYNAYIGLDLEAKVAVVVLSNTFSWDDQVGHNLLVRLSRGLAWPNDRPDPRTRTGPAAASGPGPQHEHSSD